jgi:hypothetical protein
MLDALELERIDVLKINTAGGEQRILRCLGDRIKRVGALLIRFGSESERRSLDDYLSEQFLLYDCFIERPGEGVAKYINRVQFGNTRRSSSSAAVSETAQQ